VIDIHIKRNVIAKEIKISGYQRGVQAGIEG
jgi:hypothetical protein